MARKTTAARAKSKRAFRPTPRQRKQVRIMAEAGIMPVDIARTIINPNTGKPLNRKAFTEHFRDELVKRPVGRPTFEPTKEQRAQISMMVAYGATKGDMALMIINPATGQPIHKQTLETAFRRELDVGAAEANMRVAQTLLQKCVGRPAQYDQYGNLIRDEIKPETPAINFWMKCRMGWRDGMNLNVQTTNLDIKPEDLEGMTDAQIDALEIALGNLGRRLGADQDGEAPPAG